MKAQKFRESCMQWLSDEHLYSPLSEDCLYLNIYVPGTSISKYSMVLMYSIYFTLTFKSKPADGVSRKTVLVYFYGGGFNTGGANDTFYGPDFLISRDNILVTIAYRVAIFGFLHLNSTEYTGNMGLKDQQLALKWIHQNIDQFSGNKNEILIFGQSAGRSLLFIIILIIDK